ncbi:hypothetical protein GCM10008967_35800 [Bacillus carboniphilus]|uniref:HU domain-containing protein n=1 Tax=Bacillus carboniphilus TaxID=86663 RepID=A0ABN0WNL9_9BACI
MRKSLKTAQDRELTYQRIKEAADHHAQSVNLTIDWLYEALQQYVDAGSVIVHLGNALMFRVRGSIYRLEYNYDSITLSSGGAMNDGETASEGIIASFDNNSTREQVMDAFSRL